ncbi:MAG TPA: acyl-CoA dehydrogenase family protein [Pseudonocardia sp.]|nr:acyl-CoA dehydrogenase family protein [Pseudonocardia sp.]
MSEYTPGDVEAMRLDAEPMRLDADALRLPELLRPAIEAAADEAEALGQLPDDLVKELREAGALRLLTPREQGGLEVSLHTALSVYEQLGRIDTSVAWVVWNANFGFVATLLSEAATATIWPGDHEPVLANAGSPGQAVAVDGGYRLTGTWKIVSGIDSADWFIPVAVVMNGDGPRLTEAGGPDVRICHVPRADLTIRRTWHVTGLRGSGSNTVERRDVLVPAELTAGIDDPPRIDRPLYRVHPVLLVFAGCTAVALGTVAEAIDELARLAPSKQTPFGGLLADQPRVHGTLGRCEVALRAARNLLFSVARDLDLAAAHGEPVTLEMRADLHGAMAHAAAVARDALVAVYEAASSSALYVGDRIERLHRDGMVALQHANHSPVFFEAVGRVRLGRDHAMPLF